MKKMMLALAMMFTITMSYAFTGEDAISKQVLATFKQNYAAATDVVWTAGNEYYKVAFTMNEQRLFAYYNTQGEFMAITRNISSVQLPLNLQSSLKKSYSNYWISDLFEMAGNAATGYYVTLENADATIVLKSTDGSDWTVFTKTKKS
jgi:pyruvate/2-oxoacid:ferredoxin oxidoreductase beta subunit